MPVVTRAQAKKALTATSMIVNNAYEPVNNANETVNNADEPVNNADEPVNNADEPVKPTAKEKELMVHERINKQTQVLHQVCVISNLQPDFFLNSYDHAGIIQDVFEVSPPPTLFPTKHESKRLREYIARIDAFHWLLDITARTHELMCIYYTLAGKDRARYDKKMNKSLVCLQYVQINFCLFVRNRFDIVIDTFFEECDDDQQLNRTAVHALVETLQTQLDTQREWLRKLTQKYEQCQFVPHKNGNNENACSDAIIAISDTQYLLNNFEWLTSTPVYGTSTMELIRQYKCYIDYNLSQPLHIVNQLEYLGRVYEKIVNFFNDAIFVVDSEPLQELVPYVQIVKHTFEEAKCPVWGKRRVIELCDCFIEKMVGLQSRKQSTENITLKYEEVIDLT